VGSLNGQFFALPFLCTPQARHTLITRLSMCQCASCILPCSQPPAATEHAGIAAPAPPLAGTSHRAPIILGPNAWEGQNRNRPAPGITMAHFPSLAHAAEARGGAEQQGQQGAGAGDPADEQMRLVLARLRIGEYHEADVVS
jgi:hypothetical protein